MNKEKEAVDNSNTAWCLQSQASLKGYRYQVFLCIHWQFAVIIIPNAPARTLWPCLDVLKIPKLYKIPRRIKSLNACMKY